MDFRFGSEQLALQAAVCEFCADQLPLAQIAGRENQAAAPEVWKGLADLGVLEILGDGSGAANAVEAAIAIEVLGAHLVPGPVIWSMISARLLPPIGSGEVRATGIQRDGGTAVVPHARESEVLVAVDLERIETIPTGELIGLTDGSPLDPLTPIAFCPSIPAGEVVGDRTAAEQLRLLGTVLSAAALVGAAQGALDTARSYVLEREQFGRPIGSFQAVKHILADMFVRVELARSATYAAAATVADPRVGDAARAAGGAKLLAGEAGIANGRAAVQLLGGMGFTWDMLPHYFLKRAWVLEQSFGTGSTHALALAAAVDLDVTG